MRGRGLKFKTTREENHSFIPVSIESPDKEQGRPKALLNYFQTSFVYWHSRKR
jgi:hypothetical protein